MSKTLLTENDINTMINLYKKDKLSIKVISRMYHIHETRLKKILDDNNIALNNYKDFTILENEIINKYLNNGISVTDLAKSYHTTKNKILSILEIHNINNQRCKIRTREKEQEVINFYNKKNETLQSTKRKFNISDKSLLAILKKNNIKIKTREDITDIVGQKINDLTVIKLYDIKENHKRYICKCSCGKEIIRRKDIIFLTKDCGHSNSLKGIPHPKQITHNSSRTRLYKIYTSMKDRCQNKNNKMYKYYGGRGIKICEQWNDFIPFKNWALSNGYQENLSIDRINVNGDYCPNNCRWVDIYVQNNNKTNTTYATYNNIKLPISEWSLLLNTNNDKLLRILKKNNFNIEDYIINNNIDKNKFDCLLKTVYKS